MIKRIFYDFLSKSPIYLRRITLIIVDVILISISYIIVLFFSNAYFYFEFYILLLIISILLYIFTGQYKSITRFLDNKSLVLLSIRSLVALFFISFLSNIYKFPSYENSTFLFLWVLICLSLTSVRVFFKDLVFLIKSANLKYTKVAIYGAGEAGNQLLNSLKLDKRFKVIYFFDDSEIKQNRFINGIPIKDTKNIRNHSKNFEQLLIAIPSLNKKKMRILLNSLPDLNMPILQIPSIEEISSGKASINSLKPISIGKLGL